MSSRKVLTNLVPKAELRRYLFEFKVPLSYKDVAATLEACRTVDSVKLPDTVSADNVMTFKRILETMRKRTGRIDKTLATVENNLVERAAEMGHNSAIALLAGRVLADKDSPKEDTTHADYLLTQLMDRGHALAFKISGDLAYKAGYSEKAIKFYQLAVDHKMDDNAVLVECLRNIGLINFMNKAITRARPAFERAVDVAEDPKQVMDCHYYLGQMLEPDKLAVRYHFERAAAHGLKEAFAPLGFLYLNYFNDQKLALEWFKLGAEVGDINCLIGQLDIYLKQDDVQRAEGVVDKLKTSEAGTKALEFRPKALERIEAFRKQTGPREGIDISDRWGF
ncbi:hypothetical protein TRICI_001947 [Trichomonascus ciferrii]|uniref:Tetratricopeptide repeat protein n=1 Tax=Trichomonascus ciferrii TaxID=44093 RepID=A0A642V834_9ASCO|nr:hypothetical protein TRICI_001947 [Trichomonascus ciferrii]